MPILFERSSSDIPAITAREAQYGLMRLMRNGYDDKAYWRTRDTQECMLDEHPFGLDTSVCNVDGSPALETRTYLLAWPGYTDVSVEAMKMMLQRHATRYAPDRSEIVPFRLRVIYAESDRIRRTPDACVHDLYFELITVVGGFLCGGCGDWGGAGGSGGEELTSIFSLLAALYEIPLERVTVPLKLAQKGRADMESAYNAFVRNRSERVD